MTMAMILLSLLTDHYKLGMETCLEGPPIQFTDASLSHQNPTSREAWQIRAQLIHHQVEKLQIKRRQQERVSYDFTSSFQLPKQQCLGHVNEQEYQGSRKLRHLSNALRVVVDVFTMLHIPLILWGDTNRDFYLHCIPSPDVSQLEFYVPFDYIVSRDHLQLLLVRHYLVTIHVEYDSLTTNSSITTIIIVVAADKWYCEICQ